MSQRNILNKITLFQGSQRPDALQKQRLSHEHRKAEAHRSLLPKALESLAANHKQKEEELETSAHQSDTEDTGLKMTMPLRCHQESQNPRRRGWRQKS